jgi:hypothetical protein
MNEMLDGWDTFYVIIGSSAAALTGLMFVVVSLTAEMRASQDSTAFDAFASPTIVHFCVVLLIAAILTSPGHTWTTVAISMGVVGLVGFAYLGVVLFRMRRQSAYDPVTEDWLWHVVFPLLSYVALFASAIGLWNEAKWPLYLVGASALLLLYTGIHNAWDTAAYMAIEGPKRFGRDSTSEKEQT